MVRVSRPPARCFRLRAQRKRWDGTSKLHFGSMALTYAKLTRAIAIVARSKREEAGARLRDEGSGHPLVSALRRKLKSARYDTRGARVADGVRWISVRPRSSDPHDTGLRSAPRRWALGTAARIARSRWGLGCVVTSTRCAIVIAPALSYK